MNIKRIVLTTVLTIMVIGCGSKYNIATTEDWIDFVSSTNDVEEIDKAFCSMSPSLINNTYAELLKSVYRLSSNDVHARATCRALNYMGELTAGHLEGYTKSNFILHNSDLTCELNTRTIDIALINMEYILGAEYDKDKASIREYAKTKLYK